jgi:hypothetical protein
MALILPLTKIWAIELSDSARISLLTVSPGEELYSAFGHTGIRVTDYKNDFDVVFNYGTFDFDQPGFYTNFVKGKMRYMISTDRFPDFMDEYVAEKRSVAEQQLELTTEDKQQIFAFLYTNALPENREYFYDFFWDNCATRPRDVFEKTLGPRLQYHTDRGAFEKNKTMHDMLRVYVSNRPWVDYGFDLILGLPCEKIATPRDQTFLPEYLAKYIGCATVDGKPFVAKREFLLLYPEKKIDPPFLPIHLSFAFVIVMIGVWYAERKTKKHYYAADFILFLVTGLFGTLFLSLWLFTVHYSVPQNLNMLWLIPTHTVIAFLLLRKRKPQWLKYYFALTYILMVLIFVAWKWLPQPLNPAVAPIIFLLAFRSATIVIDIHKNRQQ